MGVRSVVRAEKKLCSGREDVVGRGSRGQLFACDCEAGPCGEASGHGEREEGEGVADGDGRGQV